MWYVTDLRWQVSVTEYVRWWKLQRGFELGMSRVKWGWWAILTYTRRYGSSEICRPMNMSNNSSSDGGMYVKIEVVLQR
jgi:hypothetical protein